MKISVQWGGFIFMNFASPTSRNIPLQYTCMAIYRNENIPQIKPWQISPPSPKSWKHLYAKMMAYTAVLDCVYAPVVADIVTGSLSRSPLTTTSVTLYWVSCSSPTRDKTWRSHIPPSSSTASTSMGGSITTLMLSYWTVPLSGLHQLNSRLHDVTLDTRGLYTGNGTVNEIHKVE